MALNRKALQDSLSSETRKLLSRRSHAVEATLRPQLHELYGQLASIRRTEKRMLLRAFHRANAAWEKYFWARLGVRWLVEGLSMEEGIRAVDGELLAVGRGWDDDVTLPTELMSHPTFGSEDTTAVTTLI